MERATKISLQTESYLTEQMKILEKSEYFENLSKQSLNSFLLGVYNIPILFKEYTMLTATNLTKTTVTKHVNSIINMMYMSHCIHTKNKLENFILYLKQFQNVNTYISEDYYKRNSITFAVDKACNELCQMALEKSYFTCIASCATIEFVIATVNRNFNAYAKSHITENPAILNESSYHASTFLELLDDGANIDEVHAGINDTIKIFSTLFTDMTKIFY